MAARIERRTFLQVAGLSGLTSVICLHTGCRGSQRTSVARGKKVIVLGVDGFDPVLAERLMDQGRLPNFARLRAGGGYARLGTSTPPQSPVAWADFITGADSGQHGIFDFIQRDPSRQCAPTFCISETEMPTEGWELGDYRLPLTFWPFNQSGPQTRLLRQGTPFWDYLDQADIPAQIYDIPSNYPPSASTNGNQHCLSGLGTPDLLGSFGTYQHFSTKRRHVKQAGGGIRKPLRFENNKAVAKLTGPLNVLLKQPVPTEVAFAVHRHPDQSLARITIQGQTIVLREGEWSGWTKVRFPLEMPSFLPNDGVNGICRFYLQEVRPEFRLYVSPLNIDPSDTGQQQISEPADFVATIADELGLFYTTGFQEDYWALRQGVFTDDEFQVQADHVLSERLNLFRYALDHYRDGLLFFYFSSTDLQAHMFWWDSDEPHPIRSPAAARKCMAVVEDLYQRIDGVLGELLAAHGDQATILLLSDHGFCNFRRQFNLNTWLRDEGYLGPLDCRSLLNSHRDPIVDWSTTRAYGLGLNGLYLNLVGREQYGIVTSRERDALLEELRAKLLAVRDPENGRPVIAAVDRSDRVYQGPCVEHAPDLIVGYHRGYRCSWDTALGDLSDEVIRDNDEAWSADHCMASGELPGVLFANRAIAHASPALIDLAPTILAEFGLPVPPRMTGRPVLRT